MSSVFRSLIMIGLVLISLAFFFLWFIQLLKSVYLCLLSNLGCIYSLFLWVFLGPIHSFLLLWDSDDTNVKCFLQTLSYFIFFCLFPWYFSNRVTFTVLSIFWFFFYFFLLLSLSTFNFLLYFSFGSSYILCFLLMPFLCWSFLFFI